MGVGISKVKSLIYCSKTYSKDNMWDILLQLPFYFLRMEEYQQKRMRKIPKAVFGLLLLTGKALPRKRASLQALRSLMNSLVPQISVSPRNIIPCQNVSLRCSIFSYSNYKLKNGLG